MPAFTYDSVYDCMAGFVDLGNGIRLNLPGEEAIEVMVWSFSGKWKQPVAFWITHRKPSAIHLKNIFEAATLAILDTGLAERAIVTDGLAKNQSAFHMLGANSEEPWIMFGEKMFIHYLMCHIS